MVVALALLALLWSTASAQPAEFLSAHKRIEDFNAFCRFVADEYAYFDTKATDWPSACKFYAPKARGATSRTAFIQVLEQALGQLYDPHAHLGTNTAHSPRLVPSQADLMAAWTDGKALITDVRRGSRAERAGLIPGDEIVALNGRPIARAAAEFEPRFVSRNDADAHDWALGVALAGRHEQKVVRLRVKSSADEFSVSYAPAFERSRELLSTAVRDGIGHVRIHNSLGDPALVNAFDQALEKMADADALVIDLRDTPSGGVSSVARGILGRLIEAEQPYQRHELIEEYRQTGIRRLWVEYVAPRSPAFRGPIVVLVGRWTGSMAEGLAIGLNATRGAPILGRPMAHLLGALGESTLPNSRIVVRVPVEKLFHVDGRPRESVVPCPVSATGAGAASPDRELEVAMELARKRVQTKSDPSLRSASNGCD